MGMNTATSFNRCAEYNLCIIRGDDKNYRLQFTVDGTTPLNLTGYTIIFTVKTNLSDSDDNAKIQIIVTTHTDPTNGISNILVPHTDTKLDLGSYYYDIQLIDPLGKIRTVIRGTVEFVYEVTLKEMP